jgi:ABC-type amino acid transport substrate-binding protein
MGSKEGLMTDIVKEAFLTQAYHVDFNLVPMARIPWSISEGDSDATIGSIHWFKSKKVLDQVNFSTIYYTGMHFFFRKEQFPLGIEYQYLSELKNYRIGYIQSGSLLKALDDANIKPILVKDIATNSRKLQTKRIDMFIATELGGWGAIKKKYPRDVEKFAMTPKPILNFIGSGDIVFPHKNSRLKEIFELGFSQLKNNGTYFNILEKYYGKKNIPKELLSLGGQ